MNSEVSLDNKKYLFLHNVLSKDVCNHYVREFDAAISSSLTHKDDQCPSSHSIYKFELFEELLEDLLPYFEQISQKKLLPTYSYARKYVNGETLENHIDRPACEVSATITLGTSGDVWPIFMGNSDKSISNEISIGVGDAVLYKGQEIYHWRDKFEGEWQLQVFLHYVTADGPNKLMAYDINPESEQTYRFFDDVLTSSACDMLVNFYTNSDMIREQPTIGNNLGVVNLDVRNVERIVLSTYKDIGGRLAAVGLSCNYNVWNFDITHCSQSEFLIYPTGGRYVSHKDTFLSPNSVEPCRKLTVLAFLNDDFEGGRFFILSESRKIYPKQDKGTIIVFPSFLMHGVEDVTKGTRYSVVSWMSGPWFK